jgi:hypothetical protein
VSEDEMDDESDIVEIRVGGETLLETVSMTVAICTSAWWIDFLMVIPFLGSFLFKIHEHLIYSRYRAEFG